MQTQFSPASPAANVTQSYSHGLGWPARSVVLNTGANSVVIYPDNLIIGPYITGYAHNFGTPSQIATFDVIAPPASEAPAGPAQQQQTTLIYSDQPVQESAGQALYPQQITVIDARLTGPLNIVTGLAKNLAGMVINVTGAGRTISVFVAGGTIPSTSIVSAPVGNGLIAPFAFGEGTVMWLPATGFSANAVQQTIGLPATVGITSDSYPTGLSIYARLQY